MTNNDKSIILEFKREPFEMDFDKGARWFFESSPNGSNRENALRYIDILVSAKPRLPNRDGPVI